MAVVISCVGHLHSNSWRANLFEVRPLIINSFYFPHFKAALMLFEVRSFFEILGYLNILPLSRPWRADATHKCKSVEHQDVLPKICSTELH